MAPPNPAMTLNLNEAVVVTTPNPRRNRARTMKYHLRLRRTGDGKFTFHPVIHDRLKIEDNALLVEKVQGTPCLVTILDTGDRKSLPKGSFLFRRKAKDDSKVFGKGSNFTHSVLAGMLDEKYTEEVSDYALVSVGIKGDKTYYAIVPFTEEHAENVEAEGDKDGDEGAENGAETRPKSAEATKPNGETPTTETPVEVEAEASPDASFEF